VWKDEGLSPVSEALSPSLSVYVGSESLKYVRDVLIISFLHVDYQLFLPKPVRVASLLSAFVKLQHATISFVISVPVSACLLAFFFLFVCPSIRRPSWNTSNSLCTFFINFDYILIKCVENFSFIEIFQE
jgi:hypothetical protein